MKFAYCCVYNVLFTVQLRSTEISCLEIFALNGVRDEDSSSPSHQPLQKFRKKKAVLLRRLLDFWGGRFYDGGTLSS